MDECQRVELAGCEFFIDGFGQNRRAPFDLQPLRLLAATLRHVEPFIREGATHAAKDLFRDEIPDGPLHHSPGRTGAQIDELFGVKKRLKLRLDFAVEILKSLTPMADHGRSERAKGLFAHFHGTGYVQFYVFHKQQGQKCR